MRCCGCAAGFLRKRERTVTPMRDQTAAPMWDQTVAPMWDQTMTTCPQISTSSVTNLRDAYACLYKARLDEVFAADVKLRTALRIKRDFATLAHAHQEAPAAANSGGPWTTWLVLGGR